MTEPKQMISTDSNGKKIIAEGYTVQNVIDKLYYYELFEQYYDAYQTFKIFGKYYITPRNYDDLLRIVAAYNMPIDEFLKDVKDCNTRMRNALRKANIERVCDLIDSSVSWDWKIIDKIPGIGKKPHYELCRALIRLQNNRTEIEKENYDRSGT